MSRKEQRERAAFVAAQLQRFDEALEAALKERTLGLIESEGPALFGDARARVTVTLRRHAPDGVAVTEVREIRISVPAREGEKWSVWRTFGGVGHDSPSSLLDQILGEFIPQVVVLRGHQAIAWWHNDKERRHLAAPLGLGKLSPGWLDSREVCSREENVAKATPAQTEAAWAVVIMGDYLSPNPYLDWRTPPPA